MAQSGDLINEGTPSCGPEVNSTEYSERTSLERDMTRRQEELQALQYADKNNNNSSGKKKKEHAREKEG